VTPEGAVIEKHLKAKNMLFIKKIKENKIRKIRQTKNKNKKENIIKNNFDKPCVFYFKIVLFRF
jgi:hypothetical protein